LYQDEVIRKTAKFQGDEEIVLTAARVTRKMSCGKECTCVELSGRKGQSSKQDKFQIDLSANNWRHHIDEPNLRLIINTSNTGTGRKLEEYVFKVKSREHLAAWAAEIIQSSTFLSGS
jgi:hypothetical protein